MGKSFIALAVATITGQEVRRCLFPRCSLRHSVKDCCLKYVMEQRANIRFCLKIDKTTSETAELLREVFGANCLSRAQIFRWYKCFKDGREDLEAEETPGRLTSLRMSELVEKVGERIKKDRFESLTMLEYVFGFNKVTIRQIFSQNLGGKFALALYRKFCETTGNMHELNTQKTS